ncbi:signal peptidase I [Mycolicibacillus koreensis]|nr:signal peptidase I [Mycolicibacillus koreensis]
MTDAEHPSSESGPTDPDEPDPGRDDAVADGEGSGGKKSALRETTTLVVIAVAIYYVMLTFVARPYLIPSESMEPTLHGCAGCVGDRIVVDKLTYRFSAPQPGDVVVFRGPPSWNLGYQSIRSDNTALRWLQNALSVVGFVPPDENDLVKRVIAVGGQTVQCRLDTGLTVDGERLVEPYLDPATMGADPREFPCLGSGGLNMEFGPVTVPPDRLWVMGDNRSHSSDSRGHCVNNPADLDPQNPAGNVYCTGEQDPILATVPVDNVIGKTRFIAWPPGRWGTVSAVNPQQGG